MIKKIEMDKTTSSTTEDVVLNDLASVNLIYGGNGTGKTTLGRIIEQPGRYPNSMVYSDMPYEARVYNSEYFYSRFYDIDTLEGIYTIGKDSAEMNSYIAKAKKELMELRKSFKVLSSKEKNLLEELEEVKKASQDECWKLKREYEGDLRPAFSGGGTKARFAAKLLSYKPDHSVYDYSDLVTETKLVFDKETKSMDYIEPIEADPVRHYECDGITSTVIIGREDIPLAKVAERLGNIDWIRKGSSYLNANEGDCPFCQQPLPEGFITEMKQIFDEEYRTKYSQV